MTPGSMPEPAFIPAGFTTQAPLPPRLATGAGFGKRLAAAVVVAIVLATGGGIGVGWNLAQALRSRSAAEAEIHTVAPVTGTGGTTSVGAAATKIIPAVVDINTTIQTANSTTRAAGTGLILTSSGDVLTNNHVVQGAISVEVAIQGRSGTFTADVIGVDPTQDLAVIRIRDVSGLPTVTLADSSKLQIGQTVVAIGNALGLGGTPRVTQGTITDLDQTITASENGSNAEQLSGMIQSDAQISPGDSGGALANTAGQVVGIITAGQTSSFSTDSSHIAYAIPSSTAVRIANLIRSGQAGGGVIVGPVGYLGVGVVTLDAPSAAQLGLSISSGALVRTVQAGSPAERAGISAGSVITAINSTTIDTSASLGTALHVFKPGDSVSVTWVSGTASRTANVTLTTGPAV